MERSWRLEGPQRYYVHVMDNFYDRVNLLIVTSVCICMYCMGGSDVFPAGFSTASRSKPSRAEPGPSSSPGGPGIEYTVCGWPEIIPEIRVFHRSISRSRSTAIIGCTYFVKGGGADSRTLIYTL